MHRLTALVSIIAIFLLCGCAADSSRLRSEGVSEFQLGRIESAKSYFTQALAKNQVDPASHYYMGRILHAERKLPMAIFHYQNAIDIDPRFDEARRWLARAEAEAGKMGETLRFIPQSPVMPGS